MLGVAAAAKFVTRSGKPMAILLVSATILVLGVQGLQHARTTHLFRIWHDHRRSVDFVRVLARETPPSSVFYTLNHSGTLRHYGGRTTIRTDILDAEWLDRSVAWLQSRGFPAYLVLEDWEVESFKQRYASLKSLPGRSTREVHAGLRWVPTGRPLRLERGRTRHPSIRGSR